MRARSINPPATSQVTKRNIDVPAGGRNSGESTCVPAHDSCLEHTLTVSENGVGRHGARFQCPMVEASEMLRDCVAAADLLTGGLRREDRGLRDAVTSARGCQVMSDMD